MSKVLWELIPNVGSKAREGVTAMSLAFVFSGFLACRCQNGEIMPLTEATDAVITGILLSIARMLELK